MLVSQKLRIGVTFDLRSDYLAKGFGEEETAEFDSEVTIAAICEALAALGFAPERIGGVLALARKLAGGERWDCVFNFCEGLKGVCHSVQAVGSSQAPGFSAIANMRSASSRTTRRMVSFPS